MARAVILLGISICFTPGISGQAVDYLPRNTEQILAFEVGDLLKHRAVQADLVPALKKWLKQNAAAQVLLTAFGLDPLKDFQRIVLSHSGLGLNGLATVEGNFKVKAIETAARLFAATKKDTLKIHKVGDKQIYEVMAGGISLFATFASERALLIGPSQDLLKGAVKKEKPLQLLAAAMAFAQRSKKGPPPVWSVVLMSKEVKQGLSKLPLGKTASQIRVMTGNVHLGSGRFRMTGHVHTINAQAARVVGQAIQQSRPLLLLGNLNPATRPITTDIQQSLRMSFGKKMVQVEADLQFKSFSKILEDLDKLIAILWPGG